MKEGAYRPDWSDPLRLEYTNRLASLLVRLLPEGMSGSLSTVPGTFKPWVDERRRDAITANIVEHVAHLVRLERDSGRSVCLALEPEPFCMLETIAETVAYFDEQLFGTAALARLAAATRLSSPQAGRAMRRHVGVCYDVCHAAVEFEDPAASVAALRAAGIAIAKVQLSSAMKVAALDDASAERLEAFAEPVYLHQVVQRRDGVLARFRDLPDALATRVASRGAEWRIHFHVPIFVPEIAGFGTTQDFLADILEMHTKQALSEHLEVETYTWDVLPERFRQVTLAGAIARELQWVLQRLVART